MFCAKMTRLQMQLMIGVELATSSMYAGGEMYVLKIVADVED